MWENDYFDTQNKSYGGNSRTGQSFNRILQCFEISMHVIWKDCSYIWNLTMLSRFILSRSNRITFQPIREVIQRNFHNKNVSSKSLLSNTMNLSAVPSMSLSQLKPPQNKKIYFTWEIVLDLSSPRLGSPGWCITSRKKRCSKWNESEKRL